MAKVIMTCGKLCCGKSTYARKLQEELGAVILSIDELMRTLFPEGAGEMHDVIVRRTEQYLLRQSLKMLETGADVILDWGLWTREQRQRLRDFYTAHGIENEIHYLRIGDAERQRRIQRRNAALPEKGSSDYYVDEGLLRKSESLFQEPDEEEMDRIVDENGDAVPRNSCAPKPERESVSVSVRFAREEDLDRVNELRKQVNDLHVAGKPDVFKPGFCDELRDFIHVIREDPNKAIVVAELDGTVRGFAILNHIVRPENPYMYERNFLDIDEFGVDEACRRRGVAAAMIRFIREYAKEKGYRRLELNMWEFNRGALAFYEAADFRTFRRYMEIYL